MIFAALLDCSLTRMYVRLLGPCFKTGRKLRSHTLIKDHKTQACAISPTAPSKPRRRSDAAACMRLYRTSGTEAPPTQSTRQPAPPPPQPCFTRHVRQVANLPVPFYEPRCPVHVRRISCSFNSSIEVLFSFPLRYLSAIGYHAFIFSLRWTAPPIFS